VSVPVVDALVDFLAPTTANGNWGGYMLSHPYDNDNTDNAFRVNNTQVLSDTHRRRGCGARSLSGFALSPLTGNAGQQPLQ
jgi:hypothetical protein